MILDPLLDLFRGKAVTIPPLDGAFRPNTRLDDAGIFSTLSQPDNLTVSNGRLIASSGNALFSIEPGKDPVVLKTFPAPVTAVAASATGELAVGLETGQLFFGGRNLELPAAVKCITALAFTPDGTLWLANGSSEHSPSAWTTDLMQKGRSGSLWKKNPVSSDFKRIADRIAFPYGLHPTPTGVVVSESWAHRLVHINSADASRRTVLDHLPGYPARLSSASGGGAWLSLFAPRNRLIEFILREGQYRRDMMAEVPREYWIAPALAPSRSFLEPLQCGGIKTMGIHKPWSPSRSYGLVVRLDDQMQPLDSFHSRANGARHGVCSAVEMNSQLFAASKGGDCILALSTEPEKAQ
ncbi:hypothetical protein B5K11_25020 [Rhizobium leguminosarum bv. trifolii]|uniref:hypothetical protein n=1 Tax=Rhizobium leguminosarum TaxID=384 RepID=UPI000E2E836C|nr:hypothetical protein [Rhizobium leguminosarum]RFB88733.1 hypothetical protein B5K11_25020 [Rhizobium leguminosarum bv. trifolii]